MADVRQRTTLGNRFRFLMRFLGLTGLFAALAGGVVAFTELAVPQSWPEIESLAQQVQPIVLDGSKGLMLRVAVGALAVGIALVALWIVVELLGGLASMTGRRTSVGLNATLQIALVLALLVAVNYYSFAHYRRIDCTADKKFTLPQSVLDKLAALDPAKPTSVVVLQRHRPNGSLSPNPDYLDRAAERKVIEKVRDVVDQLREFGPRFRVTVLDTQEEGYDDKLQAVTADFPELLAAIESAPEDSIFFAADKRITRMGFGEFYLLDRTASQTDVSGKKKVTNLVLIPQGVEAFARRLEAVEERKPKVGLAVIHPVLTTRDDADDFTSHGLRTALEANGFRVADVILKKWGRGNPTPAADTFDEYELDRVEGRYNLLTLLAADRAEMVKKLTETRKAAEAAPDTKAKAKVLQPFVRGKIEEEAQVRQVLVQLAAAVDEFVAEQKEIAKVLEKTVPKYQAAVSNERAYEARRTSDVKAKLAQSLADCDILIVPRMTTMEVARNRVIDSWLYSLSAEQAEVIRDFIKSGKPVLGLFGPIKIGSGGGGGEPEPDDVEGLFARLGFEFGGQTILYDAEAEAAAEGREDTLSGGSVEVPPLHFPAAVPPEVGFAVASTLAKPLRPANPIGSAFAVTGRAVGSRLEVRRSGFRPVYPSERVARVSAFDPVIAQAGREAWNEEKPVPERDYVPKYEPTKLGDPKKGTHDEERRGPFPVGVAIEVAVPAEWTDKSAAGIRDSAAAAVGTPAVTIDPAAAKGAKMVRIVAYGHGGLFVGKDLTPAQEKLLVHTLNWQLRRDDRLPHDADDAAKWRFPRANLTANQAYLWHMGTFLGLPMACGYLGLIVLMLRKVR